MKFRLLPFVKKYPILVPRDSHAMNRREVERNVLDILNRLLHGGYQAHLVGGCVRDILLGRKPKDFDIVTDARPQQIKRLFRRCFLIGRRFRLAHVYISHDRFVEVATFRAAVDPEQAAEGGFAANNVYGTIEEDALRRDFTVNALYYNGADSSIIDYTGGLKDLKSGVLRSIGDPAARFSEDPVRIIRAARFCAQLDFTPSRKDLKAARACAPLIKNANDHRMLEELYKILRCGASAGTFENLGRFGILDYWLAELVSGDYRRDLLRRLAALDARRRRGMEIPAAVLLTALMYDVFNQELGDRSSYQDAFAILHQRFTGLATGLRIPRREWDAVCNIVARQSSFTRVPEGKKGKAFEKRFVRNIHFANAFLFFEIMTEAMGTHGAELAYWQRRAVDAADGAEPQRGDARERGAERTAENQEAVPAGSPSGRGKRRRKRR